jgi:hypothetical protein
MKSKDSKEDKEYKEATRVESNLPDKESIEDAPPASRLRKRTKMVPVDQEYAQNHPEYMYCEKKESIPQPVSSQWIIEFSCQKR